MKNIKQFIDSLFLQMPDDYSELKEEIEQHLIDSITDLKNNGLSEEEAFLVAKSRFIDSEHLTELQTSSCTNVIFLGASTGGPTTLSNIMKNIPENLPACFIVVQHMPLGEYTKSLVEHFNKISSFQVVEAKDGEELLDGKVIVAKGGFHLEIVEENGRFFSKLSNRSTGDGHCPSIDKTLESFKNSHIPLIVNILTGMGRDGLTGVRLLKENRPLFLHVTAESENSAVIFGMPNQIIKHELSDTVCSSDELLVRIIPKLEGISPLKASRFCRYVYEMMEKSKTLSHFARSELKENQELIHSFVKRFIHEAEIPFSVDHYMELVEAFEDNMRSELMDGKNLTLSYEMAKNNFLLHKHDFKRLLGGNQNGSY